MKKTLITITLAVSVIACGCSVNWESFEQGAEKVAGIAVTGEKVSGAVAPFTLGYGAAAAGIFSGIYNIASTLIALSKRKQAKGLAKAAVLAADIKPGGGKALNEAAALLNVGAEIVKAYKEGRG